MKRAVIVLAAIAVIAYLRNPAWVGRLTSGLGTWEEDPPGTRFRWTNGRASFFVPADADAMRLPLRGVFPGPLGGPVEVDVRADDRWLATVRLVDPNAWVETTLPLRGRRTTRRFRRIDLHVNRVVPPFMLGVMVGDVRLERPSGRSGRSSETGRAGRRVSGSDSPATRPTGSP